MAYVPSATDKTNPLDTVDRSTAAAEFRALKTYIQDVLLPQIAAASPQAGDIKGVFTSTIPTGWLRVPAVATNISRVTYPALHTAMQVAGYPFGAGDGTTTFGMPWMAADTMPVQANANLGTATAGSVQSHAHSYFVGGGTAGAPMAQITYSASSNAVTTSSTGASAKNLAAGTRIYFLVKT